MHFQGASITALLTTLASAVPLHLPPGAHNLAKEVEAQTLGRNPITPAPDWALASSGLAKRSRLVTCQPDDEGGQTGLTTQGDKNWVPVDQFLASGNEFCSDRSGALNQIPQSQSQSFSGYLIHLTNQITPTELGDPGHISWYVINKSAGSSAGFSVEDCYSAIGHICGWKDSPQGQSKCWGSKHNDTRGGAWELDNGWIIGGAINEGAPVLVS